MPLRQRARRFSAPNVVKSQPEIPPPLHGEEYVEVKVDAGRFWLPAGDEVMRPYMQRRGSWDEGVGAVLRKLLRAGERFLDVGAAIGYFSVLASTLARGVRVDSVEPNPAALDLLRFNLWLNGTTATVWPVALGRQQDAVPLETSEENLGDARARPATFGSSASLVVPVLAGDDIFRNRTFDVVKLDVQGWELDVLLGMQQVLARSKGVVVLTEFWPAPLREQNVDPGDVLDRYRQLGFDLAIVRSGRIEGSSNKTIIATCDSAGIDGQVDLLLQRKV